MNYTRGPLTVHHNGYEIDIEERIKAGTEVLATIHNLGRSREAEQHANAHLYAAAPQLLEALKGVLHHNIAVKPQYQLPVSLIRQIDSAIAQAEKGY